MFNVGTKINDVKVILKSKCTYIFRNLNDFVIYLKQKVIKVKEII